MSSQALQETTSVDWDTGNTAFGENVRDKANKYKWGQYKFIKIWNLLQFTL